MLHHCFLLCCTSFATAGINPLAGFAGFHALFRKVNAAPHSATTSIAQLPPSLPQTPPSLPSRRALPHSFPSPHIAIPASYLPNQQVEMSNHVDCKDLMLVDALFCIFFNTAWFFFHSTASTKSVGHSRSLNLPCPSLSEPSVQRAFTRARTLAQDAQKLSLGL